jgi:hypothetical protein
VIPDDEQFETMLQHLDEEELRILLRSLWGLVQHWRSLPPDHNPNFCVECHRLMITGETVPLPRCERHPDREAIAELADGRLACRECLR